MADFSIAITIPDAKVNDLVAAMRLHYGPKRTLSPEGNVVESQYTAAELRKLLRDEVHGVLRQRYDAYVRKTTQVSDIGIT